MPLNTLSDAETVAMVEELIGRANLAMVNTLNIAAEKIFLQSQIEVPKSGAHQPRPDHSGYPTKPLAECGVVVRATMESPVAQVAYEGPYAAAQEVGAMTYETKSGTEVHWEAQYYTTPGTKSRYLEDPGKALLGQIPEELAIQGRIALGELPGLIEPRSTLKAAGTREAVMPQPTGQVGAFMRQEETKAQSAASLQTPVAPAVLQGVPASAAEEV